MRTITRKKLTCIIGLSFFLLLGLVQGASERSNVSIFASESALPGADECAQPLSWNEEDEVSMPVPDDSSERFIVTKYSWEELPLNRPKTKVKSLTLETAPGSTQEKRSHFAFSDKSRLKISHFEAPKTEPKVVPKRSLTLQNAETGLESFPIEQPQSIRAELSPSQESVFNTKTVTLLGENHIENFYWNSKNRSENVQEGLESLETIEKGSPLEHAYPQGHHLETLDNPAITTVSFKDEVKVAQKFLFGRFGPFGPDPGSEKENRPFLNAETRPYSQPKKSTDVTSQFILDPKKAERPDSDKVAVSEPQVDESMQKTNVKKSSILAEISNQTLVNQELIAIDPETVDAEMMETESDLQQLDTAEDSTADSKNSLSEISQAESDKIEPVKLDPNSVGNPHSATLVRLMYDEVISGLRGRQIIGRYDMFRRYCGSILDRYVGANTGNERDGMYRLSWYDHLFRDPIRSIFEIEEFSRTVHAGLSGDHRHFAATLPIIREKLDVPPARNITIQFSKAQTPKQAVAEVRNCMIKAQASYTKAIATLTPAEQKELSQNLYPIFCQNTINGHTIPQRKTGRRLVTLLQKMDRTGIHEALEALAPLTDENFLRLLAELPEDAFTKVSLGGKIVQKVSTPIGDIIIGGRDDNVYDLDVPGMQNVVCVIDLGGNDTFKEGTCTVDRPVLVIISLGGNDKFIATKPGVQGGSILGISMLLNLKGKNTYQAGDVAQGSTLGGVGVLIDYDGDTSYTAMRHAQGYALGGIGLLIDHKGNDKYRAALLAQGVGHPGGFAVLEDCEGSDHYYVGGKYLDSYEEHPGYDGWGQGLGAGIRQVANGGIGCLLDGEGDDNYEYDYFAHGGGYWFGIGFARDFKGNDKRHGATLLDYYGKPRSESRWQRFCSGFGCHYSIGALFDDEGDDTYGGTIMGTGMAWDLAAGFLCDFSGNDRFEATGNLSQGCGAQAGIGILFNYGGNSTYLGNSQGYANAMMSYHDPADAGSNFSFLIDYGGHDTYGGRDLNNTYQQRGGSGGFLIDRPFDVEVVAEKATTQQRNATNATPRNNAQQPQRYDAYGRPIRSSQQQQQQQQQRRPANSFRGF